MPDKKLWKMLFKKNTKKSRKLLFVSLKGNTKCVEVNSSKPCKLQPNQKTWIAMEISKGKIAGKLTNGKIKSKWSVR